MSEWRHWAYPFPADGGVDLLWDVFEQVPTKFARDVDWTLMDKLMVVVGDVKTAVYLRMAFGGSRLLGTDGMPILEQNEVLISTSERDECETLLVEHCRAQAVWFSVITISTRTEAARQAFDEAYRLVVSETPLCAILR